MRNIRGFNWNNTAVSSASQESADCISTSSTFRGIKQLETLYLLWMTGPRAIKQRYAVSCWNVFLIAGDREGRGTFRPCHQVIVPYRSKTQYITYHHRWMPLLKVSGCLEVLSDSHSAVRRICVCVCYDGSDEPHFLPIQRVAQNIPASSLSSSGCSLLGRPVGEWEERFI